MANTVAHNDAATITTIKGFTVQAPGGEERRNQAKELVKAFYLCNKLECL